jgi:hypothetical protein
MLDPFCVVESGTTWAGWMTGVDEKGCTLAMLNSMNDDNDDMAVPKKSYVK